jgi:hypothetical protein
MNTGTKISTDGDEEWIGSIGSFGEWEVSEVMEVG